MDKKYIKKYWREVRRQAWASAWDRSGMKTLILISIVLFGAIALGGLMLMLRWVEYPFFRDNLIANFLTGLSQLLVSLVILVYFFFSLLSQIPPKIHYKQEEEIQNYKQSESDRVTAEQDRNLLLNELTKALKVRATPLRDQSVGITLGSSAELPFHGYLWLKAVQESSEMLRSAVKLLGDKDNNPNVDLPEMPFKTFLLARIENNREPYYFAENHKEKMNGNRNYVVTELSGWFEGISSIVKIENFWYLDFDEENQTLHLLKDDIGDQKTN